MRVSIFAAIRCLPRLLVSGVSIICALQFGLWQESILASLALAVVLVVLLCRGWTETFGLILGAYFGLATATTAQTNQFIQIGMLVSIGLGLFFVFWKWREFRGEVKGTASAIGKIIDQITICGFAGFGVSGLLLIIYRVWKWLPVWGRVVESMLIFALAVLFWVTPRLYRLYPAQRELTGRVSGLLYYMLVGAILIFAIWLIHDDFDEAPMFATANNSSWEQSPFVYFYAIVCGATGLMGSGPFGAHHLQRNPQLREIR